MRTFSVVIPTISRWTLGGTLASIPDAEDLEVIVVGDGPQPLAEATVGAWKAYRHVEQTKVTYTETPEHTGAFGNAQRDVGMALATGDRLVFMDDDDEFVPGAFDHIRWWDYHHQLSPLIFQMVYAEDGRVLWSVPDVRPANIGTPMFAPLNQKGALPSWQQDSGYLSDFVFISNALALQGRPVFVNHVIAEIRPWFRRQQEAS